MSRRDPNGPTARILAFAHSAPGGVIRWRDAEELYLLGSESARRHKRRGDRGYCLGVKRILQRYFTQVHEQVLDSNHPRWKQGAGIPMDFTFRGYYVLSSTIVNHDPIGDAIVDQEFRQSAEERVKDVLIPGRQLLRILPRLMRMSQVTL